MTRVSKVSAQDFCLGWQTHKGNADAFAIQLNQARGTVVARYKKYKEAGVNLCEIQVKSRARKKISDMVPELNNLLRQAEVNGN